MFCEKCGNKLIENCTFCSKCGAPIKNAAPKESSSPVPVQHLPSENLNNTRKKLCLIATACIIIIVIVISITNSFNGEKNDYSYDNSYSNTTQSSSTSSSKFEWVEEPYVIYDWTYNIVGSIKNNTTTTYSFVQVKFTIYDSSGNQIDTITDSVYNLKGGNIWKFEAISFKEFSYFEFLEVRYTE